MSALSRARRLKAGVTTSSVAPNATALGQLGNDYGLTWPQRVIPTFEAKKLGNNWELRLTKLAGEYSIQTHLPGGMQDIPDATIATQANYQALLRSLDHLGNPPGGAPTHYSLAAVRAHESKHSTRCHEALDNKAEEIEGLFKRITVPIADNNETAATALGRLQGHARYNKTVRRAFRRWDRHFDVLLQGDHTPDGPCEMAEKGVTRPLRNAIYERARANGWLPQNAQVGLDAGALGVGAARAQVLAAPPPVVSGPVQMPGGALGVAAARAQVAAPQQAQGKGPVVLPRGAMQASQVKVWPPPKD
jgi:hypothetical protein